MNLLLIVKKIIAKEEGIIYDLDKDFRNNQIRLLIKLFSEFGSSIFQLIFFSIIGYFYGFDVFTFFVSIYLFQVCMTEVIKFVFRRKRPKTFKNDVFFGKKIAMTTGSFPSGHTSNAFSSALLLSLVFDTSLVFTSIFFIVGGLVGISRILLGKHYILDVVGGAIIGLFLTVFGVQIYALSYSQFFIK